MMQVTEDMPEGFPFFGGPLSNFVGGPYDIVIDAARDLALDTEVLYDDEDSLGIVIAPTVEHWYQAAKATTPEDFFKVIQAGHPRDAKGVGRKIAIRDDWEQVKYNIMLQGLRAKFTNAWFGEQLLNTEDLYLYEASPYDGEWGLWNPTKKSWTGNNLLGRALMRVRLELQTYLVEEQYGYTSGDQS